MSKTSQKTESLEIRSSLKPFVGSRGNTTIIQRQSYGGPMTRQNFGSLRMSSGPILSAGTFQAMSSSGVADFKDTRQKEKTQLQNLNERLATYIDKVRFLEAKCKMLEDQLNQLQGVGKFDLQPIRDMYEAELAEARKVIEELSKEKAGTDAKLAGLQDEVDRLQGTIDIMLRHKTDYQSKINQLTQQIGEYEGELGTLRVRIKNTEADNDKLRELYNKAMDDIRKLRADLDHETQCHIEADNRAQSFEEECEFYKALLDKVPKGETKLTIQGLDMKSYWDSKLKECVHDLNSEYQNTVELMRTEIENRYAMQLRQIQGGAVKDNLEISHMRDEIKKLKNQLSEKSSALSDAEARARILEGEVADLQRQLMELRNEYEETSMKLRDDVDRLQQELEACIEQLRHLMDAKLSLELEICCYRQLLEGEENRTGLRQIVEQAMGIQSQGTSQLSDMIGQSSMSSSERKMTIQRSCRGAIAFNEVDTQGRYITIEHNGNTRGGTPEVNLSGWKIKRVLDNKPHPFEYKFPDGLILKPGQKFKIYSITGNRSKSKSRDSDTAEIDLWSLAEELTNIYLLDSQNVEKATCIVKIPRSG
ncbi:non-neuronal cytoplasmic intermediate filament protein B-like isoform X2 [Gigantopelta aegis]|uniref:non-neuronal cytoplasmic intermediate filament protein B-like isoform X2 n=1 Tax=Gigantopelta aegis TaxID=1735272 RepID=UPI001B887CCC|nr:non-neuronal cytoplasmic intermediate filament protein B-like isoform X2 [Gigantopelta aegis]